MFDIQKRMWLQIDPAGEKNLLHEMDMLSLLSEIICMCVEDLTLEWASSRTHYIFDMYTHMWKCVLNEGYDVPPKAFHTAVGLSDRIVVFGGISGYTRDAYKVHRTP